MNLLAIDTGNAYLTLALSVDGIIYEASEPSLKQHALSLLPMIDKLLHEAKVDLTVIDGIVFGCGPGSFTGLRIACSVAKALAYAADLPLYPVSSLLSIASAVEIDKTTGILAMLDARMGEVYWAYYEDRDYKILTEEFVTKAKDLVLPSDKPFILAGLNLDEFIVEMPEDLRLNIKSRCTISPNATSMLRLVEKGIIKPQTVVDALPVYVRNKVV